MLILSSRKTREMDCRLKIGKLLLHAFCLNKIVRSLPCCSNSRHTDDCTSCSEIRICTKRDMNTVPDTRESEVLKYKIDLDEKRHAAEKNKLLLEKEKERQELENVIDVLKDRAIDQEDKNKQLDESNVKKDIKIEQLRKKLEKMLILKEEFLLKISILEEQNSSSSETNEKQQNQIKYLERELERLENELQIIKHKYELQNKAIDGLTTEIKLQKFETNANFNTLNKQLERQSEESAKVITMLQKFSGAKDEEKHVHIQTAQHVTVSLNQKGGHTGISAERKVVPVRIFNPQLRSNGKLSISPSKRTSVNRKDQQKAE